MAMTALVGRSLRKSAVRGFLLAAILAIPFTSARAQSWLWNTPQGLEPDVRAPGYVPGELLVQFKANLTPDQIDAAVSQEGVTLEKRVTPDGLVRVRLGPGVDMGSAIDHWNLRSDVDYAAPNLYARSFFVPNDTTIATFDLAWNLRQVDAYSAWDVVRGNPKVVLAIVDSGVAFEDREIPDYERPFVKPGVTMYRQSPDLPGPFLPGWDFVHNDAHPNDDYGHGTFIATFAAGAANNTAGSAGIAFGITILPVKVLDFEGDAETDNIVQGIRFAADQGANIINLSLGYPPVGLLRAIGIPEKALNQMFNPLRDAIFYAQRKGAIIVAASGNFDAPEVSLPAGYPGVIAVGATNVDNARSSYSSYGSTLDFMAPGGDFTDLNGDHVQDGVTTLGIKPFRSSGSLANPDSFNVFVVFGTSYAAPHVSGAIALLESMGLKDQGQIEQTLRASAINPFQSNSGFDPTYGSGLIQIGRAVRNPVGPTASAALPGSVLQSRLTSSNPARGSASLDFRTSAAGPLSARIFDVRGTLVRTVYDGSIQPGAHSLTWDGRDDRGNPAPSGVYFYRLDSAEGRVSHKVAFLR